MRFDICSLHAFKRPFILHCKQVKYLDDALLQRKHSFHLVEGDLCEDGPSLFPLTVFEEFNVVGGTLALEERQGWLVSLYVVCRGVNHPLFQGR